MKELLTAIRSVEPKDWEALFNFLRNEQYQKLVGTSPENLVLLQATVKSLHSIEEKFKMLREGKITLDI